MKGTNEPTCSGRSQDERLGWKHSSAGREEWGGDTEAMRKAGVDQPVGQHGCNGWALSGEWESPLCQEGTAVLSGAQNFKTKWPQLGTELWAETGVFAPWG